MIIKTFSVGSMDNKNYLVIDEKTKEAVIIDASELTPALTEEIEKTGAKVKYILLTHGHFDHVLGVNDMKNRFGAKVLVHKNDALMLNHINDIVRVFGMENVEVPQYDGFIEDGQEISAGETVVKVIGTPGHSRGSVTFLIDGKLFSGDTLFKDYVGRTDLPGGSFDELSDSIKKLFKYDDSTEVYPGHGEQTTIGNERKYNEIVKYI